MYIGFLGAGGTGKTTTATLLAERLGLPFLPSVSRPILTKYFKTEEEQRTASPEKVFACQREINAAKKQQDLDNKEGVCDRTLIDQACYLMFRCQSTLTGEDAVVDLVNETVEHMHLKYTHLVYCPLVTYEGQDDGIRENSFSYRWILDAMLQQMLNAMSISHISRCIAGSEPPLTLRHECNPSHTPEAKVESIIRGWHLQNYRATPRLVE